MRQNCNSTVMKLICNKLIYSTRGGMPGNPLWPTKSFSPEVEALKSRTTRDDHSPGKRGEPR